MANYTRRLIIDTFSDMLERMPFDKITVTALIKECNVGRNTFYYHYEDIYALLDDAMAQWIEQYVDATQDMTWQEVLKSILYTCRTNKSKIYHIFNSLSRDQLMQYIFGKIEAPINAYIQTLSEEEYDDPKQAEVIGDVFGYAISGYFMHFLWNDMEDDIDENVKNLGIIFDILFDSLEA
ncbi:MAG: TetR/AcrR family transcriptional regulator [Ellagibacter isourolithinifaciens]|uniref:TetR/AcrR family transcriptional regulator n=1 Tax=Ellagibacter isourolithinifaciens TaxID=2137581 RepID=UPI002A908AD2|nr:TetR/AcrR family transcriptional regulator [Ellagibacter isourolithinifaciens]MDY6112262.1 TetR/AcrR family transcriptional regulator [Ellagibacter isourolithinifaciens]